MYALHAGNALETCGLGLRTRLLGFNRLGYRFPRALGIGIYCLLTPLIQFV